MPTEQTPLLAEEIRGCSLDGRQITLTRGISSTLQPVPETGEQTIQNGDGDSKAPEQSPYLIETTPTRFWIMYIPILAVFFVATFDSTLMASSHPVITSYFHSSNSASWLSTVFMLTSTTFQPLYGRLSDAFGRKLLYVFSLCVFGGTTAWCGLAQSMTGFIVARAFCGLGAGGVMAMASIITNDLVKIEHRGVYQSYINIFFGLGSSCGAAFGGFLCDHLGWRWAFGIQVPPVLLILILGLISVPGNLGPNLAMNSDEKWYQTLRDFDFAGSICMTAMTACLILGLNLGGNVLPWTHPLIISSLVLCVVAGAALFQVERRAKRPVMPLPLLISVPKANLLWSNFFSQIGLLTIIFNAPLYFQAVKLDTPSISGFRLAAPSVTLTLCAVLTGFYINWTGRLKVPMVIGPTLMLLGSVLLSSMWDNIPKWLATIFLVPASAGQGFMYPATTMSLLAVSVKGDQAVVTASIGVFRNLGAVMGVAISSLILQNTLVGYLDSYVTGAEKEDIIQRVRKSVRAIAEMDGVHQAQGMLQTQALVEKITNESTVIQAYGAALRWTFISAIVFFAIVNILVITLRLPRLGYDKVAADTEDDD